MANIARGSHGRAPEGAGGLITLTDSERTPCEVWSRVMGYHRPVSGWNTGKQGEWEERRPFVVSPNDNPEAAESVIPA